MTEKKERISFITHRTTYSRIEGKKEVSHKETMKTKEKKEHVMNQYNLIEDTRERKFERN
jgi:hypothetical protein